MPDKPLSERMLEVIEQMDIEIRALRSLLRSLKRRLPPAEEMEILVQAARTSAQVRDAVHQQYEPVRRRIAESQSLEQVLQEFLRVAPPKKDVN